ncbi:MAG: hypothetical protein K2J03_00990, partial [Muribaculaceae bacterium]|nr:hypothetical protein [Muribaculaceae bacterium]
ATRPSEVTFDYKYAPVNNEQGEAYVKILDASGEILAYGSFLINSSENGKGSIILDGYPFGKKASTLEICFRSTKRGVNPPQISIPNIDEVKKDANGITNLLNSSQRNKGANDYHAVAIGSVLTIDNVKLGYSEVATKGVKGKARSKAKRK